MPLERYRLEQGGGGNMRILAREREALSGGGSVEQDGGQHPQQLLAHSAKCSSLALEDGDVTGEGCYQGGDETLQRSQEAGCVLAGASPPVLEGGAASLTDLPRPHRDQTSPPLTMRLTSGENTPLQINTKGEETRRPSSSSPSPSRFRPPSDEEASPPRELKEGAQGAFSPTPSSASASSVPGRRFSQVQSCERIY